MTTEPGRARRCRVRSHLRTQPASSRRRRVQPRRAVDAVTRSRGSGQRAARADQRGHRHAQPADAAVAGARRAAGAAAADEASDAQNNTVTVEMREAVRFLSERLDGVTRMVAQRGEELADIRTALTAIDAHVRSQAETIGVLSDGLQALPSYGERVSVLQDNLQVLHRQLVGIEESLGQSDGDEKLGERLAAIESAVTPLGQSAAMRSVTACRVERRTRRQRLNS